MEHPIGYYKKRREYYREYRIANREKLNALAKEYNRRSYEKKKLTFSKTLKERDEAIRLAGVFYESWKTRQPHLALHDFWQLEAFRNGGGIIRPLTALIKPSA
jgi:hypothetical protein